MLFLTLVAVLLNISILQIKKGVFQVLGVGGDANLGGDDFDNLLTDFC